MIHDVIHNIRLIYDVGTGSVVPNRKCIIVVDRQGSGSFGTNAVSVFFFKPIIKVVRPQIIENQVENVLGYVKSFDAFFMCAQNIIKKTAPVVSVNTRFITR